MNKLLSYNRVVAYGCSWTAGHELLDHEILGITFESINRIKKACGTEAELFRRFPEFEAKLEAGTLTNKNASWAGQLAKMLDKPFINNAQNGSSLDLIYYLLHNDIVEEKLNGNDLIVIGLTSPNRVMWFGRRGETKNFLLGYPPSYQDLFNDSRQIVEIFNDNFIVYNYYRQLQLILSLAKDYNIRIQPTFEDQNPNNIEYFNYDISLPVRKYACHVWESVRPLILKPERYFTKATNFEYCGFGHHPVSHHIDLARDIYNQYE